MNHPKKEDWLRYVDGEAPSELAQRLTEHLNECGECAVEVAAWRRAISALGRMDWPSANRAPRFDWARSTRGWGIAAAILILGLVLGRLTTPSAAALDSAAVATLRNQLRAEMRAEERIVREAVLREVQKSRIEDRQVGFALLNDLQQQHLGDYISLRRDLETLASTADAGLNQTRRQLNQLVVTTQSTNEQP